MFENIYNNRKYINKNITLWKKFFQKKYSIEN
jgi:hypothetical protein